MQEPFTRATEKEIFFLLDEFALPPGSQVLDVGCRTGI
jgi:cyclopropane fatty-acyl-phospholipid synthase-like methyltransferase